jgi:tetratricopeptide (TPR) repeat protein
MVQIKHASRATLLQPEWGDYWYTLALVQYRNADWRESLETLEKPKVKEGALDATGWYLVAMNRHQLKQKEEAQGALRKAAEWVSDQRRKAEGNALLRYQFELTWPFIESLKQEAERLIEGKEAVKQGVG